jgi:hypothetical protein
VDFPELPMRDGPESGSASGDDAPSPPAATNGKKNKAKSEPSEVVVEDEDEDEDGDEEGDEEVEEWARLESRSGFKQLWVNGGAGTLSKQSSST